jgi:hypothetical protein
MENNGDTTTEDEESLDIMTDESLTDDSLVQHILFSDSDSDDGDPSNTFATAFIKVLILFATSCNNEHYHYYTRERLCWDEHVKEFLFKGTF